MKRAFPQYGVDAITIKTEIEALFGLERSPREDAFNVAWPHAPNSVIELALDAQRSFRNLNGFFTSVSPALRRADEELRAMIAEIFHAPSDQGVTLTVGGTESNFLAVKTARDKFRSERGLSRDEKLTIVVPYTAHPSFDKHAQMMDLDVIRVAVQPNWQADIRAMEAAITHRTFMIVGSAPSYSHGVVDPIAELGTLASKYKIWLHVDACVGGFLHPFLKRRNKLPEFDFSVDGVSSISADLHKFGYCLNGISSFTLREATDQKHQIYDVEGLWPTGRYVRKTFVGSRSGSVVGAAWAVFKHLGEDGFTAIAEKIGQGCDELAEGLATIDGLTLNTIPRCGVVSAAVEPKVPITALVAEIEKRGFYVARTQDPPSLHFLLDPIEDPDLISDYVQAIGEAMQAVRGDKAMAVAETGNVYGL